MISSLKSLLEAKQFQEAIIYASKIEADYRQNADFYYYLGAAALELRQFALAKNCFLKSIEIDKYLVGPHKNLALTYYLEKNPKAFDQLLLSSFIDPQDPQTYSLLLQLKQPHYPKDVDVVFYTASPFWDIDISPDALKTKGLGGSETAFVTMAQELNKMGKKVVCFCSVSERKNYEGVEYIPVVEFFLFNHLNHYKNFVSSRFLYPFTARLNAEKKCLWMHDIDGGLGDEKIDFTNIDYFLALSDYQKDFLINQKNYPREKFIKVKNGFFEELFQQDQKSFPNPDSKLSHSLIYFSRPSRGLPQAIETLRLIRQQFPDTQLHLCTYSVKEKIEEDPDMRYLMSLEGEPGVIIHGSLSKKDLAQLLQKIQLCLYPNTSDLETFCIVAIEAMAAGVPVITSDRGSLAEVVCHSVGGEVVSFRNDQSFIEELAKRIMILFQDKSQMATLSESAKTRAWTLFTWSQAAKEWLAFLS